MTLSYFGKTLSLSYVGKTILIWGSKGDQRPLSPMFGFDLPHQYRLIVFVYFNIMDQLVVTWSS